MPDMTTQQTIDKKLTEIITEYFLPGAIGGFCSVSVGHPMDLIKVRQQDNPTSQSSSFRTTIQMLQTIVRKDGIRGLYAGVTAPYLAVIPAFAISFASYDFAKALLLQQLKQHEPSTQIATAVGIAGMAGAFSGIPLAIVVGPTERIKCLMQVNQKLCNTDIGRKQLQIPSPQNTKPTFDTFLNTVQYVYRKGGIKSVMRGTILTICRDVPGNAAYFATYEFIRHTLTWVLNDSARKKNSYENFWTQTGCTMLAGGLAGVANWIVAIPVDVIKSRWQLIVTDDSPRRTSVQGMIRQLYQTEGLRGFFRGLTPALLRAFPANAACFLGAETTRQWLGLRPY